VAIVDRLSSAANIIETGSDSYRGAHTLRSRDNTDKVTSTFTNTQHAPGTVPTLGTTNNRRRFTNNRRRN
jgi:hypothetical protein